MYNAMVFAIHGRVCNTSVTDSLHSFNQSTTGTNLVSGKTPGPNGVIAKMVGSALNKAANKR